MSPCTSLMPLDLCGDRVACQQSPIIHKGVSQEEIDAKADETFEAKSEDTRYFGQWIACVDLNNDGCDDIVIGAQGYNGRKGRAYLHYGRPRTDR